jgi:hypothetical protein
VGFLANRLDSLSFRDLFPVLKRCQYFFSVAFRLDIREYVPNGSVRAHDKRGAGNSLHLLAVHILFFYYTELFAHFLVCIAKQGVGEVVLGLKVFLSFGIVGRDA